MNDRDIVSIAFGTCDKNFILKQITRGIHTDCLLNYETVKYFNGERHEGERYADALHEYQVLEYKVISGYSVLFLLSSLRSFKCR